MSDQPQSQDFAIGEPIAIVGIGCMFPKAPNLQAYWRNITTSQDAMTEVPESHWNPDDYFDPDPNAPDMTYARRGGFLDPVDFDPLHYGVSPNTMEAIDSTQLLTLVAAEQALADADYSVRQHSDTGRIFDRSRTSVMLGVTGTLELVIPLGARLGHPRWRKAMLDAGIPSETTEEIIARIAAGYVPWQEQSFPGLLGNVTAGRIANRLDLGGANCVVDAACASSISAIHMAVMELSLGRCDMAISGGVDTFNDIFMYMCFSKTPALSASGDVRPFSADADGTMLGEGVGVLVLKRLRDARRDGDQIRAIIKGIGASSDGAGNAIYAPSSDGQSRALRAAYQEAGVRPRTIELVEAHGTGTRVGDQVEADALNAVFREDLPQVSDSVDPEKSGESHSWCALGSVKSMIGHTKAAAGVAGVIKTVLALQNKVLPPTIKVSQPLDSLVPGRSPVYLNTSIRPWIGKSEHPRRAAVSAFGFGGSNFHCVLEEAQSVKAAPDWNGDLQLVALSGHTTDALLEQLSHFQETMISSTGRRWDKLRIYAKQSREAFSPSDPCRFVFLLRQEQLDQQSFFDELRALIQTPNSDGTSTQGFYGQGKPSGRLALVFPGQGSQRTNMLKDLSCLFPDMLTRWQQVNHALNQDAKTDRVRISEYVYPFPMVDVSESRRQQEALRATCIAQPALAAASMGLLDILSHFGLKADAFAGHSFGEFIALYAAGVISDDALLQLARERGEFMDLSCKQTRGGMLAIKASLAEVESILRAESLNLSIANDNSPSQVVVSGAIPELAKARDMFKACGLLSVALNVAGAFHSPLMNEARERFATSLDVIEFASSNHSVYSNVSAARYQLDGTEIRSLLGLQITAPIRFVEMIRSMYRDGIHTFVEAGPGKVLQTLIGAILGDQPHQVVALDESCGNGPELEDFGRGLAQLAAVGHDIDLRQWDPMPPVIQEPQGFSIRISGANHFDAKPMAAMQHPLPSPEAQTAIKKEIPSSPRSEPMMPNPAISELNKDLIQTTLLALQKMQQETSALHRQYLESQQSAQRSIELLIQQQLQTGGISTGIPTPVVASMVSSPDTSTDPTSLPRIVVPETAPSRSHLSNEDSSASTGVARERILEIVSAKTGYPREVLTSEMSLEKDLGIDSIKRVEIFSALADHFPALAALSAVEAGSLDTLQQIEAHVGTPIGVGSLSAVAPEQQGHVVGSANENADLLAALIAIIADKTGYPTEALSSGMRLDEDLGIDSIKRVEIFSAIQEQFPYSLVVEPDAMVRLQNIGDIVAHLSAGSDPPSIGTNGHNGNGASPHVDSLGATAMSVPAVQAASAVNTNGKTDLLVALIAVIADKTGYPTEALSSGMRLDEDLGIDSIKRVEIFSAIQEQFPYSLVVEPDAMVRLQNIGDIVAHLSAGSDPPSIGTNGHNGNGNGAISSLSRQIVEPDQNVSHMNLPVGAGNLDIGLHRLVLKSTAVVQKTRATLQLPANAVIGIFAEGTELGDALMHAFQQRGILSKLLHMDQKQPTTPLAGLLILSPDHVSEDSLGHAFSVIREYGPQLQQCAVHGYSLLASVSRLNGRFGLGDEAVAQPLSAGLGGIIKTAAREWPQVHCKSIDIAEAWQTHQELADAIVSEVLLDGPLEVGLSEQGTTILELTPEALAPTGDGDHPLLRRGELVLVSGGARGISAAIAKALARHYQPTLVLLGRSPEPVAEPDWLHGVNEEHAIKQAILQYHSDAKSPKNIEHVYRLTLANREILETLSMIEASGSKALYGSIDIRDVDQTTRALKELVAEYGPLRGIVHGAGILEDSLIIDKTDLQFASVLSTKCDGFINLLACLNGQDPAFIVACSSTTARLGRRGQADYAAANECLNKLTQKAARQYGGSKVLSVNWGPWDGGMVDARLKAIFQKEGVGLIPLDTGAEYLIQELESGPSHAVELVVLGPTPDGSPMTPSLSSLQLCYGLDVSLATMPILGSHVINARAVVPVSLMIEWLAHGALHAVPGLRFVGLEDFKVCKGITLEASQSMKIRVLAGSAEVVQSKQGRREVISVEVRSDNLLHARARIHLSEDYSIPAGSPAPIRHEPFSLQPYANSSLFHGADLQGLTHVSGCDDQGISGETLTAPEPAVWLTHPLRVQWLADPLVLDASFQLMILWTEHFYKHGSLPTAIGRLELYGPFPASSVAIDIQLQNRQAHRATASIDFRDSQGSLIARIDDYECVIDVSLNAGFARNTLSSHS